ncbi:Spc19p [Sporobolomyces salmoneus]|uniref:Spc19p n=1 Tax=Sporobolomyces salmoneus TaxID=183962 RepID=UPI00316E17DF
MSRLARSSMYPVAPPLSHWTALEHCSLELAQSSLHLQSSIETLSTATPDLPRIASILSSHRVYDLLPSSEIRQAQEQVKREMEPQIEGLVERAEGALGGLKEREKALRARVEKRTQLLNPELPRRVGTKEEVELAERRLAELKRRKERLSEEVEELEREVERRLAAKGKGKP